MWNAGTLTLSCMGCGVSLQGCTYELARDIGLHYQNLPFIMFRLRNSATVTAVATAALRDSEPGSPAG